MITRFRVKGYKSLRSTALEKLQRLVLIFGPNAAGKSNFLDCLDLLSHLVKEDTLANAFRRHRGNRSLQPLPIRWFFSDLDKSGSNSEMSFELDILLHPGIKDALNAELEGRERREKLARPYTRVTNQRLQYALVLRYEPDSRSLQVTSESLCALKKDGTPFQSKPPFIRREGARVSVKLERQAHPREFSLPRSRTILSEIADFVNHPHLVAVARELASIRVYYVEPTQMRNVVNDVEARDPGPHGELLASFYHWLKRESPKGYANLLHNLRRLVPGISGLTVKEQTEGFLDLWVEEGRRREFPASLISEGTLRLLCLLGIAVTPLPPAVVGYEEPENGVNPARLREMLSIVETAAKRKRGSQFFLTTHSPEVIDYFDEASRFQCRQSELGTELEAWNAGPLFRRSSSQEILDQEETRASSLGVRFARGDLD